MIVCISGEYYAKLLYYEHRGQLVNIFELTRYLREVLRGRRVVGRNWQRRKRPGGFYTNERLDKEVEWKRREIFREAPNVKQNTTSFCKSLRKRSLCCFSKSSIWFKSDMISSLLMSVFVIMLLSLKKERWLWNPSPRL